MGDRQMRCCRARFVEAVNATVLATPGRRVGTVGRLAVFPGARDVILGAWCSAELSDSRREIDARCSLEARAAARGGERHARDIVPTLANEPEPTDRRVPNGEWPGQ